MRTPIVSVVIPAYNEAEHIKATVSSLMDQTMAAEDYEIVVIDNNSTDDTWEILGQLPVRAYKQSIQGCGPAKQKGLTEAKGKYILNADADVYYPRDWVLKMVTPLIKDESIACVYSKHRFLPEPGFSPFKLYLLRKMRDVLIVLKSINRPWLNCYGMTMGYRKDQALAVGFDMRNLRGDDGRMAYDLTRFGKIRQVNAPVYTHVRTLRQDGRMFQVILKRLKRELPHLFSNISRQKGHDTKTSSNTSGTLKNKAER
ncbi:MAG: glycosyltransferase family 2 protein [Bacteroidota bacterium]|nr:glycosyltransferase family 2 protein [Bacteroidota bacterium]MDP4211706.1 glycosyltransferase family 2 protein [Bacteroidota bacterium]MDP4250489.1 glycosyltransferase family 2 protein [Bacteroidota bacterium]